MIVTPKYYYTKMAPEPEALWYEDCQRVFSQVACLKGVLMEDPVFVDSGKVLAERIDGLWRPYFFADYDIFPDYQIFDQILRFDRFHAVSQPGVLIPRQGAIPHVAYLYENRGCAVESHLRGKYKYNYLRELRRETVHFSTEEKPLYLRVEEVLQGRLLTKTFDIISLAYSACTILRDHHVYGNLRRVQLHDQFGGFSVWVRQKQGWVFYFLYQPPGKSLGRHHVHEFLQNHLPLGEQCLLHVSHPIHDEPYATYKKQAANLKKQVFSIMACSLDGGFTPPYIDLDSGDVVAATEETKK